MAQKTIKNLLIIMIVVLFLGLCCVSTANIIASADVVDEISQQSLLTESNTFVCNNYNESEKVVSYDMNNRRVNVQVMETPQITVLTHGLGSDASVWSNNYSQHNRDIKFEYNKNSIIERIKTEAGGANIYWARMQLDGSLDFLNITNSLSGDFENENTLCTTISDISKHIIIVFDAYNSGVSNNNVYFSFNNMLSKIVYDVKILNEGILPKVNLIGHSRGGLTNLQYALDHPDLVDSLVSIGTPYFGSTTANLFGEEFMGKNDGLDDIVDPATYYGYNQRWNSNYNFLYKDINAYAFGSYHTLLSLAEAVSSDSSGSFDWYEKAGISTLLGCINASKLSISSYWRQQKIIGLIADCLEYYLPEDKVVDCAQILFDELDYDTYPMFVSWYNDVLVPLESQLACDLGSSEYGGGNYLGFKRFIRPFLSGDKTVDYEKVAQDNVPIGHNLETRDSVIIEGIVSLLDFEASSNKFIYNIKDDGTIVLTGFKGNWATSNFIIPATIENKEVTEISPFAFLTLDKSNISSVEIPSTVETIGAYAFADFEDLQTVNFSGNGLENLEMGAFFGCVSLEEINLPASTDIISPYAFIDCESLQDINIESTNQKFVSIGGVVYSKDKSELLFYPAGKYNSSYTVDSACQEIGPCAFMGNNYLTNINLYNVGMVRDQAFWGCENLESIVSNSVEYVESLALEGTAWLNNKIDEDIAYVSLGQALYCYNGSEENIILDNYVSVSPNAFFGNANIQTLTIGNGVTTIGGYSFFGCNNLETVYLNAVNNVVYIGVGAFDDNAENRIIYVPQCLHEDYVNNELWQQYQTTVHNTVINYNLYGGEFSSDYPTVVGYGENLYLPVPSKENYIFDGWYVDSNFTSMVEFGLWGSYAETVDFYAKWRAEPYTISLQTNNDSNQIMTVNYEYGQSVELPTPTRTGYTFSGWCLDEELTQVVDNLLPNTTNGNFTLYGKWDANTYTIIFDLNINDSSEVGSFTQQTTVVFGQPYNLNVPTRIGNIFNGWYDENTGLYYCLSDGTVCFDVWNYAGDITLKASWTRITYYIKLTCEGQVLWLTDESEFDAYQSGIEYGTELASPEWLSDNFNINKISIKEGHVFNYFVKDINSTEPILDWKEFDYLITQDGCIIEIFPYFTREENFTLDFIGYISEAGVNPFVASYGETISYLNVSKNGYTFQNWKVADVEQNNCFDDTYLAAGNIFNFSTMPDLSIGIEKEGVHIWLEPYFTPNTYTINLSTDYGALTSSQISVIFDNKVVLPILVESGRNFLGWFTSSNIQISDSQGNMLSDWTFTSDEVLYARWELVVYNITFIDGYTHYNGSTFTIDNLPIVLQDATRYGYRFMGWYTSNDYSLRVTHINGIGDKTLYAKWAQVYTITFNSPNGSSCSSLQGISGEKIKLPTSTRPGYKGTWSYWGYITQNSNVSNFGYDYTIYGNASLTVVWTEKSLTECYNNGVYEIWTLGQFNGLRTIGTAGKIFAIMADINLGASESNSWVPISGFDGTLRGNYHTISNMIINTSANTGWFGLFESNAGRIENLTVTGYIIVNNVDGGHILAGMFAGVNWSSGVIYNCTSNLYAESNNYYAKTELVNGVVIHWNYEILCYRDLSEIGGFVGQNQGTISYCTNNSDMCGGGDVAGIAGTNHGGIISYCTNNRSIDYWRHYSNRCVAGITGYFNGGSINYCTNNGEIECVNLSFSNDTSVYPQIAQIIGRKVAGSNTGNICNGIVDQGELKSFDYGFLWFQTHNQAMYVSNGEIGQNG